MLIKLKFLSHFRMCNNVKIHICRICATPMLRLVQNLMNHLSHKHGIRQVKDYLKEHRLGGIGTAMEESLGERRINALAPRLRCRDCGQGAKGFLRLFQHVNLRHRKSLFGSVFVSLQGQLGLRRCFRCSDGFIARSLVVGEHLPVHNGFFHGGEEGDSGGGDLSEEEEDESPPPPPPVQTGEGAEAMEVEEEEEEGNGIANNVCRLCGKAVEGLEQHLWDHHDLTLDLYE